MLVNVSDVRNATLRSLIKQYNHCVGETKNQIKDDISLQLVRK